MSPCPSFPASVLAAAAGAVFAFAPAPALGSDEVSTTPDGRILHRRLPPAPGAAGGTPVFVYDPRRGGSLPREFQRDGQVMPMPSLGSEREEGEAVYSEHGVTPADGASPAAAGAGPEDGGAGEPGPAPAPGDSAGEAGTGGSVGGSMEAVFDPRGTLGSSAAPDLETEKEGTLSYHEVFDPAVVPFKRNRTLNAVRADGTLGLDAGELLAIAPAGNHVDPGREVFWGSVLLDAEGGQLVALPSVAPGSRVLSHEITPATPLSFHKDAADNFYVRPTRTGRYRLVFLMDAPSGWFGREVPAGKHVSDVPAALRPRMPAAMRRSALAVAKELGLTPHLTYDRLVGDLVRHFRSFEPGLPPPDTGDVYRDLALGKRGICRHRTYAFVVTAQGLGVPARYTWNEAHVFAEVWVPGGDEGAGGWMRVDLGGGADRLVVKGAEDKVRHRPRGRDPFDRPDAYAESLRQGESAGATEVVGLPPTRRSERAAAGGPAAGPGTAPPRRLLPPPVTRTEVRPGAEPTRTTLECDEALVFRGEPVAFRGAVTDRRGRPVAAGRVQLVLFEDKGGRPLGLLGMADVSPDGSWEALVVIPEGHPPGGFEVQAEYLGTERHASSRSP